MSQTMIQTSLMTRPVAMLSFHVLVHPINACSGNPIPKPGLLRHLSPYPKASPIKRRFACPIFSLQCNLPKSSPIPHPNPLNSQPPTHSSPKIPRKPASTPDSASDPAPSMAPLSTDPSGSSSNAPASYSAHTSSPSSSPPDRA